MPHKRAKRSVREYLRGQKGSDLTPSHSSLSQEAVPKSLARVLNAAKVREEWKKRKIEVRETENENSAMKKRKLNGHEQGKNSSILPGESLQHYNKRVENDMRPLVKDAIQSSKIAVRNVRRQELAAKHKQSIKLQGIVADRDDEPSSNSPTTKHTGRPTEFQTLPTSAPRRLNDVAQSPPEFNRLPRGASQTVHTKMETRDGVVSLAQIAMMEQERERAIKRYREFKANRRKDHNNEKEAEH